MLGRSLSLCCDKKYTDKWSSIIQGKKTNSFLQKIVQENLTWAGNVLVYNSYGKET